MYRYVQQRNGPQAKSRAYVGVHLYIYICEVSECAHLDAVTVLCRVREQA